MSSHRFWAPWLLLGAVVAWAAPPAAVLHAQTTYSRGQGVQPVYEGWQRNADGTIDMVFGYFNRNYVEEPEVPVGALNSFSPGVPDRGQPSHFYPRRQAFVFRVTLPRDWAGKQELVWTVVHNSQTATAVGSLLPVWELDAGVWQANRTGNLIGRTTGDADPNQPPRVSIVGPIELATTLTQPVTLTVAVSDDGKPGAKKRRGSEGGRPPADAVPVDVSIVGPGRSPQAQDMVKVAVARETGLAVSWLHYRGPGEVAFNARVMPISAEGKATTAVRFSQPGTYVLRAVADDGVFTSPANVTVIVK